MSMYVDIFVLVCIVYKNVEVWAANPTEQDDVWIFVDLVCLFSFCPHFIAYMGVKVVQQKLSPGQTVRVQVEHRYRHGRQNTGESWANQLSATLKRLSILTGEKLLVWFRSDGECESRWMKERSSRTIVFSCCVWQILTLTPERSDGNSVTFMVWSTRPPRWTPRPVI